MKIDWTKISDENQFRDLCNYLLSEELGWSVISVSKGRDEGIDASFKGNYKNKKGDWIFQYKWFDEKVGNEKNRSLLKSKIVGGKDPEATRVQGKHNPDHYVLITNISLTIPLKKEISSKAIKNGVRDFIVYDQADLDALITNYPNAQKRFFNKLQPSLETYSERFARELKDPLSIYFCGSDAAFYGRQDNIAYLERFITDNTKMLVLYGRGGVGKTRLLIELSKKLEQENSDAKVYFVREGNDLTLGQVISEIPESQSQGHCKILVFDDAHNYSKDLLLEINNLLRQTKTNIKFIFVTRPELKQIIINSLPTQGEGESITEYELANITISDIRRIIEKYINDRVISRQITDWARTGKWGPLEAILIVKEALRTGKSYRDVVTESQLLDRLFNRYLESYSPDAKTLLELVSFLQPMSIDNPDLTKKILDHLGWQENKYINAIDDLTDASKTPVIELLTYREKRLKVKPDILGDWLRARVAYNSQEAVTARGKKIITDFILVSTEQLLTNVAQTEYGKREKILNDILKEIEQEADNGNNSQRIELLKYLKKLAWFRPSDTLLIIKKIISNPKPDYTIKGYGAFKVEHEHVLREIPEVLSDIAFHIDYFFDVIETLFELSLGDSKYAASKAKEELIRLSKLKFRRSLEYNFKILDLLKNESQSDELNKIGLVLELLKEQFVTNVDYDYWDPEDPRKLNWTSYPIKAIYNPEGFERLKKLREDSLDFLFNLISKTEKKEVRKQGVEVLPGVIGHLISQRAGLGYDKILEEDKRYPLEPELGRIVQFLESLVQKEQEKKNPDFLTLDAVIGCLNSIKEEKTTYDTRVKNLRTKIKKSDQYCFYDLLLAEHRDWDKDWNRRQLPYLSSGFIKRIVDENLETPIELVRFLETLLSLRVGWIFGSMKKLATEIGEKYPELSGDILAEVIKDTYPNLAIYGGYFIIGIRSVNHKQAIELVDKYTRQESSLTAKGVAVDSYDRYWVVNHQEKNVPLIRPNEIEYLERLTEISDKNLRIKIASSIHAFLMISKPRALNVLQKLSSNMQVDELQLADTIADSLDPRDISFDQDDLEKIKLILKGFVPVSNLDKGQMMYWHIEQVMTEVLKVDPGFIIDLYEARIGRKNQTQKDEEYDAIPFHVKFPTINDHEKEVELCRKVRNWALQKNWFRLEAPRFLKNFGFSLPAIETVIKEWVDNEESDAEKRHELIVLAAYLLRDFEDTEWLYDLLASICKRACLYETEDKKYKDIMGEVMACIYSGSSWGDSKQKAVISNLNRILEVNKSEFCERVKRDLNNEIERQTKEAEHLNDLLNSDW